MAHKQIKLSATEQSAAGNRSGSATGFSPLMMMITLIDDDDGVREGTASLLRSLGYEVSTFGSGRAFLDWTRLNHTHCVIMDVMMPEIDGFELQRRLVASGFRFPVIFLTALTDSSTHNRMIESGAYGILSKPCSEQKLIDCIESALNRARTLMAQAQNPH